VVYRSVYWLIGHHSRPNGILQVMRVRERLTSATATLMQRHGVAGTGIAEILSTSGVTRRSIYLNFPGGKAELVAAATRSAGDELTTTLRDCIGQPDPIGAFTGVWSEILISTDFEGGCPIVAAAFSRAEAPEAASTAADVFAEWGQLLADRLHDDGINRSAAQSLSMTIVAALEGAVILSRAARSIEPLEQVSHHLNELIAQHRPAQTRVRRRRR
jgi:TetR/AcrR family transcriptional repressor of lmrAB and yxaGH operons